MEIISITNQKGGTGKSTTALALGAALKRKGHKVLYIDLDAQGNLTYALGATGLNTLNAMDLLNGKAGEIKGDIIASTPELAAAEQTLNKTGKEYKLKEALRGIKNKYDYIIIDTPPSMGILTINALTASDSVLIPAQADIFSLQGITQIKDTIDAVREYCNKALKVKGIVLTRFNGRAIISKDLADVLKAEADKLGTKLFNVKIRECTALKEAQANQRDIFSYAPASNGASDYMELTKEVLKA